MLWARRILADHDALKQEVVALQTGLTGELRLGVIPAAATNQFLIHTAHLSPDWTGSIAAVVLGFAAAAASERLRMPMSASILTGALLPGLVLYQGMVVELFHTSGIGYFVRAFTICVGLGVGAALGVLLFYLTRSSPRRAR